MNRPYASKWAIVDAARRMDEGMMHHCDLEWLYDQASKYDYVAEIGCWEGRTTMVMAAAGPKRMFAIDTWQGSSEIGDNTYGADRLQIMPTFLRNINRFPNVVAVMCDSSEAASYLPDMDMVFIDANHTYEGVKKDILQWGPKAKRLLCGHDPYFPGVKKAVIELLGEDCINPAKAIWVKEISL